MINLGEYLKDFFNEMTLEYWIKTALCFALGLFLLLKGIPWIRDKIDELKGRWHP